MEVDAGARPVERCPGCGALLRPSAAWCGQCLRPRTSAPAPGEGRTPAGPAGRDGAAETGEDAWAFVPRQACVVVEPAAATLPSPPGEPGPLGASWPCLSCGRRTSYLEEACPDCGTPFLSGAEAPAPSAPATRGRRVALGIGVGLGLLALALALAGIAGASL